MAIYALKIFLFKTQFKLTASESKNITDLALFASLVHVKQWIIPPLGVQAPLNDIEFLSNLKTYPIKTVTSRVHEAFLRLWFHFEHLVGIALLNDRVSASIKEKMVQNLNQPVLADNPRHVKLTSDSEQLNSEDLVTERTTSLMPSWKKAKKSLRHSLRNHQDSGHLLQSSRGFMNWLHT